MSNEPQGLWVPPWGWVLLAAVFHQILRKDPGEEASGRGTASHLPTLWPHSQSCPRPIPGWVGHESASCGKRFASQSPAETVGLPGPGRDRALSPP